MKDECELCGQDATTGWIRATYNSGRLCERCVHNLTARFAAFFGVDPTHTDSGLEINWPEVKKILNKISRDQLRGIRYIETERSIYERECLVKTPVTEGE